MVVVKVADSNIFEEAYFVLKRGKYSIVDVYDIIEYLEEKGHNPEDIERIKNYLTVYGAKA